MESQRMTKKIEKIEGYELTDTPVGYRVKIITVPVNLPTDHRIRCPYDDRSIIVPNTHGSIWMEVYEEGNDIYIAHGDFAATEESVMCATVEVNQHHRRKGIATVLYDLAEKLFEQHVVPSPGHSEDAQAFWAARVERRKASA
jgi:hypothetical protein